MKHKCIFCKKETEWKVLRERIFSNGTKHLEGQCEECHRVKLLPQEKPLEEYTLFFGKHKGQKITEIPIDYLKWCIESDTVGGGTAWAILKLLEQKGVDIKNYRKN